MKTTNLTDLFHTWQRWFNIVTQKKKSKGFRSSGQERCALSQYHLVCARECVGACVSLTVIFGFYGATRFVFFVRKLSQNNEPFFFYYFIWNVASTVFPSLSIRDRSLIYFIWVFFMSASVGSAQTCVWSRGETVQIKPLFPSFFPSTRWRTLTTCTRASKLSKELLVNNKSEASELLCD